MQHFKKFQGRLPESHGQNLALTVGCVPESLESGPQRVRSNRGEYLR